MVSTVQMYELGKSKFQSEKDDDDLTAFVTTVDKVAIKNVRVSRAGPTTDCKYLAQVWQGSVEITNDDYPRVLSV